MKPLLERFIRKDLEAGQAIVLIALFMVLLIGTLGLAIDGGGLLLLWRDAQNAADTAVLQASYALCTAPQGTNANAAAIEAGTEAADENGFITSTNALHNTSTTVTVSPQPSNYGTNYVEVTIEADKPSYFIQLLYGGRLSVRVTALAFCTRAFDSTSAPGMMSGAPDSFCATQGLGSSEISITGSQIHVIGDVHSNGDVSFVPNNSGGGTYDGDMTAGDEAVLQNGTLSASGSITPDADTKTLTQLVDLQEYDFAGGGAIATAIRAAGGRAWTINPSQAGFSWGNPVDVNGLSTDSNSNTIRDGLGKLEGLIYVRGNFSPSTPETAALFYDEPSGYFPVYPNSNYNHAFWAAAIPGWEGVTIIAEGQIDLAFGGSTPAYLRFYDSVTVGGDYPSIVFGTDFESPSCNSSSLAINYNGAARVYGGAYTPRGSIGLSFSDTDFWGFIYAGGHITLSGSSSTIYLDPRLIPSNPPSTQRVYQP